MAHYDHLQVLPLKAASAIVFAVAVAGDPANGEQVMPASTANFDAIGLSIASTPTYGYGVAVVVDGVAKGIAAASIGAMARVGAASVNGALGPVIASGPVPSGAADARRYSVGMALQPAAAGEYFAVLIDPRQIA